MDPAMRLVILWPAERGQGGHGVWRATWVTAGVVARARIRRSLPRWLFSLLVSCAFLLVTACAATPPGAPTASGRFAAPAAPAASKAPPTAPSGASNRSTFIALGERARRHVALLWGVDAEHVHLDFETPSAAKLLLAPAAALRIQPLNHADWVVVFDARPGTRPELRLPFRAAFLPASTPVQTVPR